MLKKALKAVIGLALLPIAISVSVTFYRQFGNIDTPWTREQQYFLCGVLTYCFIQLLVFKPAYLYVLSHEAVHVLATWLSFGKVRAFRVTSTGGSVSTSKSSLFISLSPYFVPLYAIILTVIYYFTVNMLWWLGISARLYFLFLLGMTIAFHIITTIDTLKTKQPDLIKTGYLTSSILIYVINMIIVAGVLGLLTGSFSFKSFLGNALNMAVYIYKAVFAQLFLLK